MEVAAKLKVILPHHLNIDYSSTSTVLVSLFKNVTRPQITLGNRRKITFPDRYSVEVGESREAFVLLLQPDLFNSLPLEFRKTLLDLLFLVMKGNVYNIIRFQSSVDENGAIETFALVPLLLNLLGKSLESNVPLSVLKRIIHLTGIAGSAGMSTTDMKLFLTFLRTPSELTVSLLQSLKIMLGQDHITSEVRVKKASPSAIFDFGGCGSGLTTHLTTFPFSREYQFCTWFRVENFEAERDYASQGYQQRAFNVNDKATQHVMTWHNSAQKGIDIFIDQRTLFVAISNSSTKDPTFVRLQDCQLQRGVWYHISVRHSKPRLALFSSDELSIHMEDQLVFQESVRFPGLGCAADMQFSFGTNFDGQMAPIYLFSEALPPNAIKVIANMDAGRPIEGVESGCNQTIVDLLSTVTSSDRKVHPLLSKMMMSFHPSRTLRGHALDIHSGRHAKFGAVTQAWVITNARDLLNSMGGLSCILPMFPRLLIENETYRSPAGGTTVLATSQNSPMKGESAARLNSPSIYREGNFSAIAPEDSFYSMVSTSNAGGSTGLGDSLADLHEETSITETDLDHGVLRLLRQEREEYLGEGCVGLLLSIIAKCIVAHRVHQQELVSVGGIEMIEYALTCTPQDIMQGEGERCVFSLRELQKSASDLPTLERRITKSLLCNFAIWHRASFPLVSSLMSVILEAIKMRPSLFVALMGVKPVLDSLEFFTTVDENSDYFVYDGNDIKNSLSHSNSAELGGPVEAITDITKAEGSEVKYNEKDHDASGTESTKPPLVPNQGKRIPTSRGICSESSSGGLSLCSLQEDEEVEFTQPSSTSRSSVTFINFDDADKASTPSSRPSIASSKKLNVKRMKSFKLTLTEVIQDNVDDVPLVVAAHKRGSFRVQKHCAESIPDENHEVLAALREDVGTMYTAEDNLDSIATIGEEDTKHSVAGSEYTMSMGFVPAPQSPEQRKHLRDCLEAMVVALVLHGGSDKEVCPILDFMIMCKDRVVLNEIAQILLYLIVERGPKFMHTIINACNGPEEFASFVLLYLIHQPYEELRCTGIRILTHFYLRVDQVPPAVVNITLKQRRKGSMISRAIPNISQMSNSQGLQRLQMCGGLALLCEVVSSHSKASSELTYSALLELLLTKPGAKCQVTVQYTDLFELSGVHTAPAASPRPQSTKDRGSIGNAAQGSGAGRGHFGQRSVVFAANYLSPDQVHDEAVDMMNAIALPIFFELLPKLPLRVQGQIYSDLLALLKHSEGNCHAFVNSSSWHLCMFGLVSQLVSTAEGNSAGKAMNSETLLSLLESWSGCSSTESPFVETMGSKSKRRQSASIPSGELLRTWRHSNGQMVNNSSYSYHNNTKSSRPSSVNVSNAAVLIPNSLGTEPQESDKDLWFALGMKIYATLLLHAIEFKGGWREIDRSISQSYESDTGYSIAQTVLSHVLNELTFSMRSKYRELQRLAKSPNVYENQEAMDKIENFLCLILTTAQLALVDQRCAINGIKNFHLCKLRVHYFTEIYKDFVRDATSNPSVIGAKTELDSIEVPPSEMRQLLERTEIQLSSKLTLIGDTTIGNCATIQFDATGARLKQQTEGDEEEDGEGDRYYKHLSFFHTWYDISTDDSSADASHIAPINLASTLPSPMKSIEELLHPLERNHDLAKGKLVLVLQALRFFDVIFWSDDSVIIRNAELMRFNKEEKAAQSESGVNGGVSGKLGPSDQARRKTGSQPYPMSMFSSVMRMCLLILSELSPVTHLAVMNVKRMRVLVNSIDKIPQFKTPTHDWLLAAILHTTLNIQRISLVLQPIYEMLGVTERILVPTLGPWSDSYDEFDRMDPKASSALDAVGESPEMLAKLQRYFDSAPGRNLIRNIRASLLVLADAFELHHDKLSATLEERTFRSLWVFVEHYKVDNMMQEQTRPISMDAQRTVSVETSGTLSRSNSIAAAVDGTGDIFESPASQTSSSSPKPMKGSFSGARFGRRRSTSEDLCDDMSDISGQFSEAGSTQGDRPRSQTGTPLPLETNSDDSFQGTDLLMVLKWMRFPYFRLNPYRSLSVIRAVDALDYLEGRSVHRFAKETQVMKDALEEQRDLAVKSVEEMTELKELSLAVYDMMSSRNDARGAAAESAENLKLKNIAARWHDCIQTFEEDWSPWRVEDMPAEENDIGCAHHELSKHHDSIMRRMVTTKLSQPTFHKDAAYLEGKIKDQFDFEHSLDAVPTQNNLPVSSAGPPLVPRAILPFKNRAAMDKAAVSSSWGDDDEDTVVEEATGASSIAGGIANLLYWNEKRPHWTYMFHWASDERLMFESDAMQIKLDQIVAGSVILTNKCLYFHSRKNMGGLASLQQQPFSDKCWHLERIVEAYGRRYLLQNCAIELFFIDAQELFLAFKSMSELQRFFRVLRRQYLPLLNTPRSLNPKHSFSSSQWTDLWRRRQISNFEYLMRLNIMAGRSFNDITQYPVFPWVIADYESDQLDLTNPHTFRRLDLPVGALNPTRLDEFLERFRSFDDDTVPKFMYGSHYSSAGVVLHYMVRQEPFTTLAINLQGGRFDCPDRVFFEISRTWENCNQSMSDVKEMIPELFCCPEALINTNNLPLGNLQEGGSVGDVKLPPWAKDAFDFVRINRAALESDYVSDNLPAWIDLIFGYKQTGPNAIAAKNVFYYLTYENSINIDSIEDPLQREAAKAQVTHFGQTPSQLLNKEHPRKLHKDDCIEPLCADLSSISSILLYTPISKQQGSGNGAVIALSCCGDRLVACHANLTLSFYRWSAFPEDDNNPFTLRADRLKVLPSAPLSSSEEILRGRSSLLLPVNASASTSETGTQSPVQTIGKQISENSGGGIFEVFRKRSPFTKPRSTSIHTSTKEAFDELFTAGFDSRQSIASRCAMIGSSPQLSCRSLSHMNVAMNIGEIGAGRIITCGYWDNSLKVHSLETMRDIASSKQGHQGAITCVQQGGNGDGHTVITGGVDGTCRVWICEKTFLASAYTPDPYFAEIDSEYTSGQSVETNNNITTGAAASASGATSSPLFCVHILWGHQSPVRCLSYSSVLDMSVSGGEDGRLCLHSVRTGKYIRSISHTEGVSIDLVVASAPGYIVAHSWTDLQIHVFWINGQHLLSTVLPTRIECMITNSTGLVLITGSNHGLLSFREIWSLQELYSIDMNENGAIRSLAFTEDQQYLLVGSEDGTFSVATDPEARWRSFNFALQKTPILGAGI